MVYYVTATDVKQQTKYVITCSDYKTAQSVYKSERKRKLNYVRICNKKPKYDDKKWNIVYGLAGKSR